MAQYVTCFNISGNINLPKNGGHTNGVVARSGQNHSSGKDNLPGFTNGVLAFFDGDFQSFDYASFSGGCSSGGCSSSSGSTNVVV